MLDAGASHGEIERSGNRQREIAERIGIQTVAILSPKQPIAAVDGRPFQIQHAGEVYKLSVTRNGKLILTK